MATSNATTYQCPQCGGVVAFNVSTGKLTCNFCGTEYERGAFEVDIPLEGAAQVRQAEHVNSVDAFLERAPWTSVVENAVSYSCRSCGAEVIADQSTVSTSCPYCGNVMIVSGIANSENVPQAIMPFTVTKDRAEARMRQHFEHKWYLSRQFDAQLSHMQGIYVPYHLYDLRVWGGGEYIGYHEETDDEGHTSKTGYKGIVRSGYIDFERLPVDGSAKMPDGHMDAIAPFDFHKLQPFAASYVAGYLTEVADEDAQTCLPRAEKRARTSFEGDLKRMVNRVRGVDGIEETIRQEVHVDHVREMACVLPVWLMHCTWEGHDMLFAVNGDTGKCVGDLPVDKGRRTATVVVTLLVLLALSAFITFVVMDGNDDQMGFVIGSIILSLVGTVLLDSHFMKQMHTATESRDAAHSYGAEGFVVTEEWDSGRFHMRRNKARDKIAEYRASYGPSWQPDDAYEDAELPAAGPALCRSCGAELVPGQKFCMSCGAPIEAEPEPPRCRACGAELVPGQRFCVSCGAPVEEEPDSTHCRSCGAELVPGQKFCVSCGAPIAAAASGAVAPRPAGTSAAGMPRAASVSSTARVASGVGASRSASASASAGPSMETRAVRVDGPHVQVTGTGKQGTAKKSHGCLWGCLIVFIIVPLIGMAIAWVMGLFTRTGSTSKGSASSVGDIERVVSQDDGGDADSLLDSLFNLVDSSGDASDSSSGGSGASSSSGGSDSGTPTVVEGGDVADGWHEAGGSWYYVQGGVPLTGWQQIDGYWYLFDASGAMAEGLVDVDGATYFFMDRDGVPEWPRGAMVCDTWSDVWEVADKRRYFYSDGTMARDVMIGQFYVDANGLADTW